MVLALAKALPKRGYTPSIIAVGGTGPLLGEIQESGIHLAIGPSGSRRLRAAFCYQILRGLPQQTILHTHLGADLWLGIPSRVMRRDLAWISTCHNDDRDDSWMKRQQKTFAWNHANHLVCVSHAVETFWRARGLTQKRTTVIPNGVEATHFSPRSPITWPDTPCLLMVGRLVEQKNQETVLRALARVKRPWRLEIVGDGPRRSALERLAEDLGIAPRVQFRGVQEDVHSFFASADLFLFPSRWEGQGIALLEAIASGIPSIVSDIPVFHEFFTDKQLSFAPAEDVDLWTNTIEDALAHPKYARERAFAAWQQVTSTHTTERMIHAYVDLYDHLTHQ